MNPVTTSSLCSSRVAMSSWQLSTSYNAEVFAVFFLRLHHHADLANEIFWGIWLIPFGLLVYKSRFMPRFLGVWLMAGCLRLLGAQLHGFM
jgi:Domain of unknown function (DUF4386)